MQRYYSIHNLVTIDLLTENQFLLEELEYSLRYFLTQKIPGAADIVIRDLGEFSLPEGSFIVSETFFGFSDGFYNKDEEYALRISGEKIYLYVKENVVTINALVEYFLLKKGATFIHGGGVSYRGEGIIFPAPPNTGKTTLMSILRKKQEVKFLGDDYVIVDNLHKMHSYPMDFSIHDYHFQFFKELATAPENRKIKRRVYEKLLVGLVRHLPIRRALRRVARNLGYEFLKGGDYLKISAERLVGAENIGKVALITRCFFLNKYHGTELRVEKIDLDTAITEILGTLQNEWYKSLPAYHHLAAFGLLDFADHLVQIKETLKKAFSGIQSYRIFLPADISHQERFKKLEEFLEKTIFKQPGNE